MIFKLNSLIYKIKSNSIKTILIFSKKINLTIPYFCYHPLLSISGNCRICMVEVIGNLKPVIACATLLMRGMIIYTNSELVKVVRENVIEFLLINHPLDCPICDQAGECDLQDLTLLYGSDRSRFIEKKTSKTNKYFNDIIKTNMTRCINCTRCVRYADEIAKVPVIGTMGKGVDMEISNYLSENNFISEISGNIIDICPVGALNNKLTSFQIRNWELDTTSSIDLTDSFNQNILIQTKENRIIRILSSKNNFCNFQSITDTARFFYLQMEKWKLLYVVVSIKINNIIHFKYTSWEFAILLFYNRYFKYINNIKIINFDNYVDYFDLKAIKLISDNLLFYNINNNFSKLLNNKRKNWLLNFKFKKIYLLRKFFFIFLNLKNKNSILNVIISKYCSLKKFYEGYLCGIYYNNIYKITHLFISINYLNNFYINKFFFKNFLINKFINYNVFLSNILYNINQINGINYKLNLFIKKINKINRNKHKFNFVCNTSIQIMSNELSLNILNISKLNYSFFYNISSYFVNNSVSNNLENKKIFNFVIFQISNRRKLTNIDYKLGLFLPIKNIYENTGVYYNLFSKKQLSKQVLTSEGDCVLNYTLIKTILMFYKRNYINFKKIRNI